MYTLNEMSPALIELAKHCKAEALRALDGLEPSMKMHTLRSGHELFQSEEEHGKIYLLRDGILKYTLENKLLYYAEDGDVAGLELLADPSGVRMLAEFAVKVDVYECDALYAELAKSPERLKAWNSYLGAMLAWFSRLLLERSKEEAVFTPSICMYAEGDVLIEQGAEGDKVFTLLEGRCDVLVDDVKVGEVMPDEMFGAVSLLTNKNRIASVVATTDCMAVVLSRDEFHSLAQSKPDTVLKLAQDLSRAIISLNDKVVTSGRLAT